ncbi:RNA-guided endonuclease InsQ/TnpB family protein [Tuanshanicoccus lijuaniae]|uniref:RNA-guided endonuclease InsQ/TnpB family protein n=1 Tax=Aerococcaceae bacterium zg-1292 TaxID=2774330 RepID=UPI001BD85DD5|nr:transposase [Aerococcaceae bacterium zg-A91]MBS4458118.1 transposase [Aerococcaceae bacterium zg-BR33]
MLQGKKIRLLPTPEQEILFKKSVGVARWAYNYAITRDHETYEAYKEDPTKPKYISEGDIRKEITQLKKTECPWLAEVGSNVAKQAVRDWNTAKLKCIKGLTKAPRYKSKTRTTPSFYVNYESFRWKPKGFQGERLGVVKTAEPLPKIGKNQFYYNPRISYDGKYWYVSFTYDVPCTFDKSLTNEVIGIDLGVKTLMTCSNGETVDNINHSKRVKQLTKRLRRYQHHLSRQLTANTTSFKVINGHRKPIWKRPINECRNIQKSIQEIKLIHRSLANIRNNHIHQATTHIVKQLPKAIVIEDLNVSGMMKNKHLAKEIQNCKFYTIRQQLEYKCARMGIELVVVDRFYASSKLCSGCGHKKQQLKLSERTYQCECCGTVLDRDFNAAKNLEACYLQIA